LVKDNVIPATVFFLFMSILWWTVWHWEGFVLSVSFH